MALNLNIKLFIALLWTSIVTVLSTIELDTTIGTGIKIANKDKYAHFIFYFLFVIVWYNYFKINNNFKNKKIVLVITAILFGIAMELFQANFTVSRHGDLLDVLVNSIGAILGMQFINYFFKNKTA